MATSRATTQKGMAVALLAVALLFICGCARASHQIEIVYIPKSIGIPYFGRVIQGFADGCAKLGCKFSTVGPATADATSQLPYVVAQIQRGVSVIAITPNSIDALNRVFDHARRRGIRIIIVNADITGFETHRDAAVLPVDFARVGPDQVELMARLMGGSGDFAILSATTDAPDQNRWIADIKRMLAREPRLAALHLVKVAYGDDEPEKSATETEALLSNFPDLKGLLSPTAVGLPAAARVIVTRRAAGRVHVTGLGTPDQMRSYVESGAVKAFQLWDPYEQGLAAAYLADGMVRGKLAVAPGASFAVPGLGNLRIGEKDTVLVREDMLTFTSSNIARYRF